MDSSKIPENYVIDETTSKPQTEKQHNHDDLGIQIKVKQVNSGDNFEIKIEVQQKSYQAISGVIQQEIIKTLKEVDLRDLVTKDELKTMIQASITAKMNQNKLNENTLSTGNEEEHTQSERIVENIKKIEERLDNLETEFKHLQTQAAQKDKADKASYLKNMKLELKELLSSGEISLAYVGKTLLIANTQSENSDLDQVPPVEQKVPMFKAQQPEEVNNCFGLIRKGRQFEEKAAAKHVIIESPKPGELEKATFAGPLPAATESFSNASIFTSDDDCTPPPKTPSIMMEEYRQFHCNMLALKDSVETLRLNGQPTFKDA